jgi:hypothetical protein
MRTHAPRLLASAAVAALVAAALIAGMPALDASNPRGAHYCSAPDTVFWFLQASDLHIGTSGSTDTTNLSWLVNTARTVINPSFIVVTGDLTDSTNGNWLGYPNGPYQQEWDSYNALLSAAGITAADYYDLPGNHDAYNDRYFTYYLANSVQGRAHNRTQHSWTREFAFGKYHFLGVNSSDNTGAPFSLTRPWGDYAGLDISELAYIRQELIANAGANLTFVFGHHPVTDTGSSDDTWLFYGHEQFVADLNYYRASSYGYGHTHDNADTHFAGNSYTGAMPNGGMRYVNVDALGKDSPYAYRVFAVDCDGVSSVTQADRSWPLVIVTAPVSKYAGSAPNPYANEVPNEAANPIRALVFDANPVSSVSFKIGSGATTPMTRVAGSPALWSALWDASGLAPGQYAITVTASSPSGTKSHTIQVDVTGAPPENQPPVAVNDNYTTTRDVTLTVPATGVLANDTDPEGSAVTIAGHTDPARGTLTMTGDGGFTYVPAAGYAGVDSFTYTASDGEAVSNTATVSLTINVPPPAVDTVTITAATWNKRTKTLSVSATSSAQPNVKLTVFIDAATIPAGEMSWNAKKKIYTFSKVLTAGPASIKVMSSGGGSATRVW